MRPALLLPALLLALACSGGEPAPDTAPAAEAATPAAAPLPTAAEAKALILQGIQRYNAAKKG
jgi:hypothetical protein